MADTPEGFQAPSLLGALPSLRAAAPPCPPPRTAARYMCDKLNKKSKNAQVKPFMVKTHLWVFANTQIVNPAFDSQAR